MDASKENARKALKHVKGGLLIVGKKFVEEFLEAAIRKLPTQAAFDREREKRLRKKGAA